MRNRSTISDFLTGRALPLWAGAGFDHDVGGFVERLCADGRPDLAVAKRVRVQARQIYVYAHAALLGMWPTGGELALRGFDFLDRHARAGDAADGFIHSVSRDGQPLDTRCDSYDHAFLLFAFSWLYRASGSPDVRRAMDEVIAVIDARLSLSDGGVAVDTSGTAERQQNPNMHLFEALLAAAEATGEEQFLVRADALYRLFADRLFDRDAGVLREFYASDWRPAPGDRGDIIEPGHHCEWIWLLKRHADAHRRPVAGEALRLADFVERFGRSGGAALLCDELKVDGRPRKTGTRIWPQTEAIKAEIALGEIACRPPGARVDTIVDELFAKFLDRPIGGAWLDRIDAAGTPVTSSIPASTLYHLFLAFAEYLIVGRAA